MTQLSKDILSLAVPSILANITVPLVGMADIAVAGHLGEGGGAAALIGGITIGTMLFDLLYWNFAFLRSGTGGLTAQAYGRASLARELRSLLFRALRIALISGAVLIALQWVILWVAFMFVDCSPEVQALATQYFKIRIWAAPATLSLFAFKGWFIGLQDTVKPMIADLLVSGLNIALSFGLGFGLCGLPEMGFAGIAWGTVIAQWCGFAYAALAARTAADTLRATTADTLRASGNPETQKQPFSCTQITSRSSESTKSPIFVHQDSPAPSFFKINRDLVLRSMGMIAIYIGFTVISARYGDTLLSVSAILMKLLLLFSYFTDGFAYAGEALTGKFTGAGNRDSVHKAVRGTFIWSAAVTALFMLVYGFGGQPILHLMTSDENVLEAGREFLPWLLAMPLIGVPAFIWDGILTGATATKELRSSVLLSAIGFFGFWFAGKSLAGSDTAAIHILMAAYFVHLAIRSVYLTVRSRKVL